MVLDKFCNILECALVQLPGKYRANKGDDVVQTKGFSMNLNSQKNDPMESFYKASGCLNLPVGHVAQDAHRWPRMCMYSKILNSMILGPGKLLREKQAWLKK